MPPLYKYCFALEYTYLLINRRAEKRWSRGAGAQAPRSGDRGIPPRYPAKPWNHIRAAERSGRDASVEAQIASTVEKHNVCTDVLKTRGRLQHLIDFETERTKLVNV